MPAQDKFFTICNHHFPSKAQAKDDRLNGQRTDLIYTKLYTFPSRAKNNILKVFLIVCLILENQWLIFLCAFVFFVVKYDSVRLVSVQNRPWA